MGQGGWIPQILALDVGLTGFRLLGEARAENLRTPETGRADMQIQGERAEEEMDQVEVGAGSFVARKVAVGKISPGQPGHH